MKIPPSELISAERKCTLLAELKEDYRHIIEALERNYGVTVSVQIVRPVIGGGTGPQRLLLFETERHATVHSQDSRL